MKFSLQKSESSLYLKADSFIRLKKITENGKSLDSRCFGKCKGIFLKNVKIYGVDTIITFSRKAL
jgi:hypothetical protein